ncbi:hypothetical protein EX30DRAFT_396753 [Ascodesmis nigricans]|uniref:Uncharacterized protein n=1 Tax=Ascodesmis nigricans TaxID=341454 RepID=A0A4S2MTZ2_9PEZI|nr:hypothetical protein EX30DRAFT_396753 [Ascodesmis nigricans]
MSTGGPPNINPYTSSRPSKTSGSSSHEPRQTSDPSQLHAHMKYAKGAAEETLSHLTSSSSLSSTGQADKTQALEEMRAAKSMADSHAAEEYAAKPKARLEREGKIERRVGSGVGCGGLVERGEGKVRAAGEKGE